MHNIVQCTNETDKTRKTKEKEYFCRQNRKLCVFVRALTIGYGWILYMFAVQVVLINSISLRLAEWKWRKIVWRAQCTQPPFAFFFFFFLAQNIEVFREIRPNLHKSIAKCTNNTNYFWDCNMDANRLDHNPVNETTILLFPFCLFSNYIFHKKYENQL